jgi:hypothetical protein
VVPQPLRVRSRPNELWEIWVTAPSEFSNHVVRVRLEPPNQLLMPCMTDSELSSPSATARPCAATREPLENESLDHP